MRIACERRCILRIPQIPMNRHAAFWPVGSFVRKAWYYSQHFVLGKEKREGDTVTCQGKKIAQKIINPNLRNSVSISFTSHQYSAIAILRQWWEPETKSFHLSLFSFHNQTPVFFFTDGQILTIESVHHDTADTGHRIAFATEPLRKTKRNS
jgi:hypothetical protein